MGLFELIASSQSPEKNLAISQNTTEILVPFIGGFSSGKSSLINALLDESLLSTDITPETALPIELRVGKCKQFKACWPDGRREKLIQEDLLEADFSELAAADGWVQATLPHLRDWSQLVLVDLPGWSSGQSEHERHIDEYLWRLAKDHLDKHMLFVLAAGADEGTLRDNVRERLASFDFGNTHYLLVLTKVDKRTTGDLEQVKIHVTEAVTQVMGKPPMEVVLTSARKKQVEPLRAAISRAQETMQPPKTAENTAALGQQIDQHLARLKEAENHKREFAIDVFENLWDVFSNDMLEDYFSCILYSSAKIRSEGMLNDLDARYQKILSCKVAQHFPVPAQHLLLDLKKPGVNPPPLEFQDGSNVSMSRHAKKHVQLAIEKAKPGMFSSDDPDKVGARICDRLRDIHGDLRGDVIGCAHGSASSWLTGQIDEWQRLRSLIG